MRPLTLLASPKRKRESVIPTMDTSTPTKFGDSPTIVNTPEIDGSDESPRSKVAGNFSDLHLQNGDFPELDLSNENPDFLMDSSPAALGIGRKRPRYGDNSSEEIPETPDSAHSLDMSIRLSNPMMVPSTPPAITPELQLFKGVEVKKTSPKLAKSYPSINRLADSLSRGRKRCGTPPLSGITSNLSTSYEDTEDVVFKTTDPDQWSLTWHDDEITGYNPSDPEDDGYGVNGVGFKPTAAQSQARSSMRRKQLDQYKNREMKEARATRMQRRRGEAVTLETEETNERKVRFESAE